MDLKDDTFFKTLAVYIIGPVYLAIIIAIATVIVLVITTVAGLSLYSLEGTIVACVTFVLYLAHEYNSIKKDKMATLAVLTLAILLSLVRLVVLLLGLVALILCGIFLRLGKGRSHNGDAVRYCEMSEMYEVAENVAHYDYNEAQYGMPTFSPFSAIERILKHLGDLFAL